MIERLMQLSKKILPGNLQYLSRLCFQNGILVIISTTQNINVNTAAIGFFPEHMHFLKFTNKFAF